MVILLLYSESTKLSGMENTALQVHVSAQGVIACVLLGGIYWGQLP